MHPGSAQVEKAGSGAFSGLVIRLLVRLLPLKADRSALRIRWFHQSANRVKDRLEAAVVLAFDRNQLAGQVFVGGQELTEPDESTYDLDIDLDGV